MVFLLEIPLKGLRYDTVQGRALFLGEQHGTAVEVRTGAHIERPGERLLGGSAFALAQVEIIVHRFLKGAAQGFDIRPLVADEAADILDLAIEDSVFIAVVDRTSIAFIGHRIFHIRPSRASVSRIWSIW
jgi:hypothetical protein